MSAPLRVGVIGVGVISRQYFESLERLPSLQLVAVGDINEARAAAVAAEEGVDARPVGELLASDDVDAVIKGIQTARRVIDDAMIGEALGASVHWSAPGHERWHPAPGFYYQPGGGPLYDMGPYYLTSLVHLLGPVARVSGVARRSARERVIQAGPDAGTVLPVDVDTHVAALLQHQSGVSSTVTATSGEWAVVRESAGWRNAGRGYGLADMAAAIAAGTPHRASGEVAFHVLDIMESILTASASGQVVELSSTVDRPKAVALSGAP